MKYVYISGLLLANILAAGCRSSDKQTAVAERKADDLDPRTQMLKAMDSVTSYRRSLLDEDDVLRDGSPYHAREEVVVEVQCPGRSHRRQTNNGRVKYDTYFIEGSEINLRFGEWKSETRKWKIAPGCPGDQENGYVRGSANEGVSGRDYLDLSRLAADPHETKFTKSGLDTVDGAACQVWETTFPGHFERTYTVQFWIGTNDNLPRRVVVTFTGDQPGVLSNRVEIQYWDWNSSQVRVTPPI